MCLSPVSVNLSNRVRFFNPDGILSGYQSVPCGHCSECLSTKQNGFFVRALAEHNDCISKGGKCVFLTFTYSDDFVPNLTYSLSYNKETSSYDIVHDVQFGLTPFPFDLYCFHKPHLQTFLNSIRKKYERLGFTDCLRYFITSEYGSDARYTQRPHYHALFYLNFDLVSYYDGFSDHGIYKFLSDVNSLWHYGIVSPSKKGLVVDDGFAASYCSKYVGKGSDLDDYDRFNKFKNFLSFNLDSINIPDFPYQKSLNSYFRYYMRIFGCSTFVMTSRYFGSSLMSNFDSCISNFDVDKCVRILKDGIGFPVNGETIRYNYPQYIIRKLLYTIDKPSCCYVLTPFGFYVKKKLVSDLVDSFSADFDKVFRSLEFRDFCNSNYGKYYHYSFDVISHDSFRKVALYHYFLRNRYINKYCFGSLDRFLNSDIDSALLFNYLYDSSFGFHMLHGFSDDYYNDEVVSDFINFESSKGYKLYSIPHYNTFLDCYFDFVNRKRKSLKDVNDALAKERKLLCDILNFVNYGIS